MAIGICSRCEKMVDLDWNCEDIVYINNEVICTDCLSETEWEELERDE